MNANQIINMILRQVMRRFVNKGIDAGVNMAVRRRGAGSDQDPEAARRQTAQGRETARRAKQAMRIGRRIGRF